MLRACEQPLRWRLECCLCSRCLKLRPLVAGCGEARSFPPLVLLLHQCLPFPMCSAVRPWARSPGRWWRSINWLLLAMLLFGRSQPLLGAAVS